MDGKMKRSCAFRGLTVWTMAGLLTLATWVLPAQAAEKYTARITSTAQADHPSVQGLEKIAALVRDRTHGEVDLRIFPNGELGGEAESLEGMKLGSIQGGLITSSLFTQWVPEYGVIDLPFIFRDDDHAEHTCAFFQQALAPKLTEHGFRPLGCFDFGGRDLISTFPITKLSDVQGRKMRVIQSPAHVRMWQLAGANPTPIAAPEVYSALQSRVVDFLDNPASNYLTFKWYEVAPHFTKLGHVISIQFLTFSTDWLAKLPKADLDALQSSIDEIMPSIYTALRQADTVNLKKTETLGATVHEITDRSAWRQAMHPMWDEFENKVPTGKAIVEQVQAVK
jgi:TRAP-type transport system periplasmic protein